MESLYKLCGTKKRSPIHFPEQACDSLNILNGVVCAKAHTPQYIGLLVLSPCSRSQFVQGKLSK